MSAICCFGVCVPYSAILPLLLIVLQYIVKPLHNAGLVPDSIARRLGLTSSTSNGKSDETCTKTSCCNETQKENEGKEEEDVVVTIQSSEDYTKIVAKYNIVIIKMTAEWCKPCKLIHPFYSTSLAPRFSDKKYGSEGEIKFTVMDVDEVDEIAADHSVSILPTFIALKNGKKVAQYTGSDEKKLEAFVQEICQ